MTKLISLIDENGLMQTSLSTKVTSFLSNDRSLLLRSLLDTLEYGHEISGWCQLRLPSMTTDTKSGKPIGNMNANSKLMLPILLPCLRLVLSAFSFVEPSVNMRQSPPTTGDNSEELQTLLNCALSELDQTLTASIVGLNFSSARDVALEALATFRKLTVAVAETGDESTTKQYQVIFIKVVNELRFRYESERRLRDTALFDAYDDAGSTGTGVLAAHECRESSLF